MSKISLKLRSIWQTTKTILLTPIFLIYAFISFIPIISKILGFFDRQLRDNPDDPPEKFTHVELISIFFFIGFMIGVFVMAVFFK